MQRLSIVRTSILDCRRCVQDVLVLFRDDSDTLVLQIVRYLPDGMRLLPWFSILGVRRWEQSDLEGQSSRRT